MKTVGELLKSVRLGKQLTLEQAETATKIRKKYLAALEENDWQKLPSLTYARGFIKNYADFLGQDLTVIMAAFRRQEQPGKEIAKVLPSGLSEPLNEPFFRLTPSKIVGAFSIFLIFLFFLWLFFQSQSFIWGPKIILTKPFENEVVKGEKVLVSGKIDPGATLTINGQEVESLNGEFNQEVAVNQGTVTIEVVATNKSGKKQEVKRTIRVESP